MPNPDRPRYLTEIISGGLIFVLGALLWSTALAPVPEAAPELAADIPEQQLPQAPTTEAPATEGHIIPDGWKLATGPIKAAAENTVRQQVRAFARNDYETAVKYQSSALRKNFENLDTFRAMMLSQYPQFAAPADLRVLKMSHSPDGNYVLASVRVTGRDGTSVWAEYTLIKEQGAYKVAGVTGGEAVAAPPPPLPSPDQPMAPPPGFV